jgi:hypothetical protein
MCHRGVGTFFTPDTWKWNSFRSTSEKSRHPNQTGHIQQFPFDNTRQLIAHSVRKEWMAQIHLAQAAKYHCGNPACVKRASPQINRPEADKDIKRPAMLELTICCDLFTSH